MLLNVFLNLEFMSKSENQEENSFIPAGNPIDWDGLAQDPVTPGFHTVGGPESASFKAHNWSKYPNVAGTGRLSVTRNPSGDVPKRSWLGWFLWGDGTPPPGVSPGIPGAVSDPQKPDNDNWDYFSWQYPSAEGDKAKTKWTAQRLDQQPLYLNPLRINNNWPCARFGYQSQPLKRFKDNYAFWSEKKIVRGPNISLPYPYFEQYANKKDAPVPDEWQNSWLYLRTKPLETLVLVPSCMKPDELIQPGTWNDNDPFPYPVWDKNLPPQKQTPYNIKVDRVGDWDADIIWEGTNPSFDEHYPDNCYQRSAFHEAGKGRYLKMTVAHGSPFVWCETNGNKYSIFYNLIQQNAAKSAVKTRGAKADDSFAGPFRVPGVTGVSFVLLNGDQNNPNQPYQETEPFGWNNATGQIGGWNPPGQQHSRTFIAIFYRDDTVVPVSVDGKSDHFYLEHLQAGKNWYAVAALPVMHYYHSENAQDRFSDMFRAACDYAGELGKYAFNFLTKTEISYEVTNMYKVCTTHAATFKNPYLEANPSDAGAPALTAGDNSERKTVMALMPHHYQPIGLGRDLTQPGGPELRWYPLLNEDKIAFNPVSDNISKLKQANKSNPKTQSRWGYWTPKGNMKTILASQFTTQYLFQNFLPFTPPPDMDKSYKHTGIQAVKITHAGAGNHSLDQVEVKAKIDPDKPGSGAELQVILDPASDQVKEIYVIHKGSGYPEKKPDDPRLTVIIDKPSITRGRQATAWAQVGSGGEILAVFMIDKGTGYRSVIKLKEPVPPNTDPPVIFPPFDQNGQLTTGMARVLLGGAGFDFSNGKKPELELWGTGTGAELEVLAPGEIFDFVQSNIGGFTDQGAYPKFSGNPEDIADRIAVHVPPPDSGTDAQEAEIRKEALMAPKDNPLFKFWIRKPGKGLVQNVTIKKIHFKTGDGKETDITSQTGYTLNGEGQLTSVYFLAPNSYSFPDPVPVLFTGQDDRPIESIEVFACTLVSISSVALGAKPGVTGYQEDVPVSFSGGDVGINGFSMPELDFTIRNDGTIALNGDGIKNKQNGKGFIEAATFILKGGKGFDAELAPVMRYHNGQGELVRVLVKHPGSHYPDQVDAFLEGYPDKKLTVTVNNGRITSVELKQDVDYTGLPNEPVIRLVQPGQTDFVNFPPKLQETWLHFEAENAGAGAGLKDGRIDRAGVGYVPGTELNASFDSPPAIPKFAGSSVTTANQAANFIARVLKPDVSVAQVLVDSLIAEYARMSSDNQAPFGGAFAKDGRDGYGMGGVLSASSKLLGIMYHVFQYYADRGMDVPPLIPGEFAYNSTKLISPLPEHPFYMNNNPLISLQAAIKVMTQSMQRTFSLLFRQDAFRNKPDAASDWTMDYFAFYDQRARRTLMNPTSTIPAKSIMSAVIDPPDISVGENEQKTGLKQWTRGMLWSGFGVSDQWNDQHYFYGYYLSSAAIFALLDGAWLKAGKPAQEWSDKNRMGTAVDQLMMTLAYDPALKDSYYSNPDMNYDKYAFFDRWNGHSWATGVAPGIAGPYDADDLNAWKSKGKGNYPFNDENENSIWEGLQAWSAVLLWGGATRRKAIVDQGIYLLATGNAAADLYFLDKNYNLQISPANEFSWCPVTTGNPQHYDGGNSYPPNTDYGTSNPEAFYGDAAAGVSTIYKGCIGLNNFFYDYPTGSKTIQAFPPTPWTMGICRNTTFMEKWARAMRLPAWGKIPDSELYSPSDWLSMAMTSAMCGMPYNPGDQGNPDTYVNRIWSSWVTNDQSAGANITTKPMETPLTVLNFLHTLDVYGTPDWTIYAKVVDKDGNDADQEILYSACFSKQEGNQVVTRFVAFNPNWESRYVNFYRILDNDGHASLGSTPLNDTGPIEVKPKKMAVVKKSFDIRA
jgi:hypothetical protein